MIVNSVLLSNSNFDEYFSAPDRRVHRDSDKDDDYDDDDDDDDDDEKGNECYLTIIVN